MRGILNIFAYTIFWLAVITVTVGLALLIAIPVAILTFGNMPARAAKAEGNLTGTLMSDETLIVSGLQHRALALLHRRVLIAITSSRVISIRRGLLGGFTMQDIQWKDLRDARLQENVLSSLCGSHLVFQHSNRGVVQLEIDGIPSEVARQIYSRSQSEEQAWEEKRRIRAIEEARAVSGGINFHAGVPASQPQNRMVDEIAKARQLLDAGAISDAEYNEMKAKILSTI